MAESGSSSEASRKKGACIVQQYALHPFLPVQLQLSPILTSIKCTPLWGVGIWREYQSQ